MNKYFIVSKTNRLDKFLSLNIDTPRNQIEQLIKRGFVKIDGKVVVKKGLKLKVDQQVKVDFPQIQTLQIKPKEFLKKSLKDKKVQIIYEDDDILVLNKPYNLVVHDAPSVKDATLVDWLKLKNISLSTISGEQRHGIVHRLDKGTSGVMIVAKSNEAHIKLSKQLESKSMGRYYFAIIDLPLKENLIIEKPIKRDPNNRLKMAIIKDGKYAKSAFIKIASSKSSKYELIAAKLFTGRTHQIRVHISSISRHILGDNLYGFKGELNKINRFYLHAYSLYFYHPITNEKMSFQANIPDDMKQFLEKNFEMEKIDEQLNKDNVSSCFSYFN